MLLSNSISSFQSHIRKRRAVHRRDLPWRKTTDPYKIRISETMLCQTQVSRVVNYYNDRMRTFPTVEILAQATNTEVLSARSGLGYNSRGLRVLQAAKKIVAHYASCCAQRSEVETSCLGISSGQDPSSPLSLPSGGRDSKFPSTYEDLIALPGIGDYVANAILAFAYNEDVAVIDTNIRRILIHQFQLDEKTSLKDLKSIALDVLPGGYARERYNALMDYGALELTSKKSGIRPTSRQSKFEGSRRQVRAWIVKEIIKSKGGIINESVIVDNNVGANIIRSLTINGQTNDVDTNIIRPLTISEIQMRFSDRDDIQSIVDDLIKENIIEIRDGGLKIKN